MKFKYSPKLISLCLLLSLGFAGTAWSAEKVQGIYLHGVTLRNKNPKSFFNEREFQKEANKLNKELAKKHLFGYELEEKAAIIPWGNVPEGNYTASDLDLTKINPMDVVNPEVAKNTFAAFAHSANGKYNNLSRVTNPFSSAINTLFHNFAYDMQWMMARNDYEATIDNYFDNKLAPYQDKPYILFAHSAGSALVIRRVLGEYEIQEAKNYAKSGNDLNHDASNTYSQLKGIVVFGSPTSTFSGALIGSCNKNLKTSSKLEDVQANCDLSPALKKFLSEGKFIVNVSHVQDFVSLPWFAPTVVPRLSNAFDTFFFNLPSKQPCLFPDKYPNFKMLMWRPGWIPQEQLPIVASFAFVTSHSRYWASPKKFASFLHTQLDSAEASCSNTHK